MLAEIGRRPPPFALADQHGRNATPLEDDVMGDPTVLVFDRTPVDAELHDSVRLLHAVDALKRRLDGIAATVFVLTVKSPEEVARLTGSAELPLRVLSDSDGSVFRAYGIDIGKGGATPACIVLDPAGRVAALREGSDIDHQMETVLTCLREMDVQRPRGMLGLHPPVLVIPNALDAAFCQRLIEVWQRPVALWEGDGMVSDGFNVERGDFKVRNARYGNVTQYVLREAALGGEIDRYLLPRIAPEIDRAFGYRPRGREEYRIACYDSAEGGSLPAHRDNPTKETRHRRFTVSVNLNNDDFEGGELAFREYSDHRYDVARGRAIVWSCSLLHEILPVTAGRRFIVATHLTD